MNRKQSPIGTYPEHWDLVVLDSVAELKHGYQFRTPDFTNNGIKVFKITQITSNGTIDINSCDHIESSRIKNFKKFVIKDGDILMALSGATIGKIARFNSNETVLQNYRVGNFLPLNDKILSKDYFYYFLTTDYTYQQILANLTQSAQENVGKNDIHKMLIFLPPLPEQTAIASVFSCLDNKIDLLHHQNKTLEQLAETLFRQWFVEEAEEEESDLDNWVLFDPREKLDKQRTYQVFDMKCLSNKDMNINAGVYREITSATIFRNDDTLLAKITPCLENGKTGFVMHLDEDEIAKGSTEFIVMRAKNQSSPYWIYCLARNKDFRDYAILSMTGTSGRQRVQMDQLKKYQVKVNSEKMKHFHLCIEPYFKKIKSNQTQIRTLTQLRDTLLPKLMSGEVRVKV